MWKAAAEIEQPWIFLVHFLLTVETFCEWMRVRLEPTTSLSRYIAPANVTAWSRENCLLTQKFSISSYSTLSGFHFPFPDEDDVSVAHGLDGCRGTPPRLTGLRFRRRLSRYTALVIRRRMTLCNNEYITSFKLESTNIRGLICGISLKSFWTVKIPDVVIPGEMRPTHTSATRRVSRWFMGSLINRLFWGSHPYYLRMLFGWFGLLLSCTNGEIHQLSPRVGRHRKKKKPCVLPFLEYTCFMTLLLPEDLWQGEKKYLQKAQWCRGTKTPAQSIPAQ